MPETVVMDGIDSNTSEASPSSAPADANTAAGAEPPKYIKGRLKAKLAFWKLFCTSTWVLSWIFFLSFLRKKPYMSTDLANTIKETSRNVGYTARPTPGEATSPWQANMTT